MAVTTQHEKLLCTAPFQVPTWSPIVPSPKTQNYHARTGYGLYVKPAKP